MTAVINKKSQKFIPSLRTVPLASTGAILCDDERDIEERYTHFLIAFRKRKYLHSGRNGAAGTQALQTTCGRLPFHVL